MNFFFLILKVETFCLARAPMKGIPDATNSWASKFKFMPSNIKEVTVLLTK